MNPRIADMKKRNLISLFIFVIGQLIIYAILHTILTNEAINDDPVIYNTFMIVAGVGFIIIDIAFYIQRIYKLNGLLHVQPIEAILEEFVALLYSDDGQVGYSVYPILRDKNTGDLLFTYNKYCLGVYDSRYVKMNNILWGFVAYRKDGSKINIGDTVSVYIRRFVPVNTQLHKNKDIVKLNKSKYGYAFINNKYDANVFNSLKYFEGVIDVDGNNRE